VTKLYYYYYSTPTTPTSEASNVSSLCRRSDRQLALKDRALESVLSRSFNLIARRDRRRQ